MPRSKKKIITKESKKKNFFSQIKWDESYVSLLIGLTVVIVIAALGIFFAKSQKVIQTSSTQFNPSSQTQTSKPEKGTYLVKSGDSLWSISENFYKSGYNWVDIAKANKLENPGMIFAGNKLIIPKAEPKIIADKTISPKMEIDQSIAGNSYTIEKGDSLWNISVRAYGDGFSWTRIAKANSLSNPNLIFPGNILKIPR